jgi:hypothetical protein
MWLLFLSSASFLIKVNVYFTFFPFFRYLYSTGSTSSYSSKLNAAVEEHLYLSSTTRLSNITTIDKENTLFSPKKPTTSPAEKDNRAFISKVYESESDDTEDDTYLTSFEDPRYYFPLTKKLNKTMNSHDNYDQDQDQEHKPDHFTQTKTIDHYDHTTNTDDDYDDDSDSASYSNYKSRQDKFLTPTKYRNGARPPLWNILPTNNVDEQKQSDDDETSDSGLPVIIPSKYKRLQKRIDKIRNEAEKENRLQQPVHIQNGQNDLQSNQYHDRNGLNRDTSPSNYQQNQSQNRTPTPKRTVSEVVTSPSKHSSSHNRTPSLQQRESKVETPPSKHSSPHNRTSSPPPREHDEETPPPKPRSSGSPTPSPPPREQDETRPPKPRSSGSPTPSPPPREQDETPPPKPRSSRSPTPSPPPKEQDETPPPKSRSSRSPTPSPPPREQGETPPPKPRSSHNPTPSSPPSEPEEETPPPKPRSSHNPTPSPPPRAQEEETPPPTPSPIRKYSEVLTSPPKQSSSSMRKDSEVLTSPPKHSSSPIRKGSDTASPPNQSSRKQTESKHNPSLHHNDIQVSAKQESESDEEPQPHSSINNIDRDHGGPFRNQYKIVSGSFELTGTPSDNSLYTYEPKHTQMQLIFKATVQGSDDRSRTHSPKNINNPTTTIKSPHPNSLQPSNNIDHQDTYISNSKDNDDNEHPTESNRLSTSDSTSRDVPPVPAATKSDNDEHSPTFNDPSTPPSSSPSSKNNKKDSKPDYDIPNTILPSSPPKTPVKTTKHVGKYCFGEKVQHQSSDEDSDERECVTFGHNSQPKSFSNKDARRSLDYSSVPNPRVSTKDKNYSSNFQFGQQTDAGTTITDDFTPPRRSSSSGNQSTPKRNPPTSYKPPPFSSNNQTSTKTDHGNTGVHTPTNTYYDGNQNIKKTSSNRGASTYQADNDQYEPNIGNYANQQQSSNNLDEDENDENQPPDDADDDPRDTDGDDGQADDPDINDPNLNNEDDHDYHNFDDDNDNAKGGDENDQHSTPRRPGVNVLVTQNPVRNTRENTPPTQYPDTDADSDPEQNTPTQTKPKKSGGFFSNLFKSKKNKSKDDGESKKKPSKQKSSGKKKKTRSSKQPSKR